METNRLHSHTGSESKPSIKVIGVGRGGCNAINQMVSEKLADVEFITVNRDPRILLQSKAFHQLLIGSTDLPGLDGSEDPGQAEKAAESSADEISRTVHGADLIFVVATLGGSTGTGAAPVVARLARETGALTVGIATLPFIFEGSRRMRKSARGIEQLRKYVDTLILLRDDQIKEVDIHASLVEAFRTIDHKIAESVKSIIDLLILPNLITFDLSSLRSILGAGKLAQVLVGKASGEDRARTAAIKAISSCPLDLPIDKADGFLVNFTCSPDLALVEVNQAVELILKAARPEARIVFGVLIDPDRIDEFQGTIFATGYENLEVRKIPRYFIDL